MDKNTAIFALSNDIDTNLKLKIISIEGQFKQLVSQSSRISNPQLYQRLSKIKHNSDLFITVQLLDGNVALTLPVQTTYVSFDYNDRESSGLGVNDGPDKTVISASSINISGGNNSYRRNFNQWINMPINYSQLPLSSRLVFKIYEFVDNQRQLFGECEIDLFDGSDGTLKRGHQSMQISLFDQVDKNADQSKYQTELTQLEQIIKKLETINVDNSDQWLNSLIIKKIEKLNKKLVKKNLNNFNMYIELVNFDVNIIYNDFLYSKRNYKANNAAVTNINGSVYSNSNLSTEAARGTRKTLEKPIDIDSVNENSKYCLVKVLDPEQYNNQPIESKYHQLERSSLNNSNYKQLTDKNLKPNLKVKKQLNKILSYSSVKKLENQERNLIYKFRYYLINNFKLNNSLNSNFLNFLLKSINWENNHEIFEIQEILNSLLLNKLPISLTNNLELLGPLFRNNNLVRNFAVNNLEYFSDSELNLYLLQLIQALKFDKYDATFSAPPSQSDINFSASKDLSVLDFSSKQQLSTLFKTLKYDNNSGPINDPIFPDDPKYHLDDYLSPLANLLIYKSIHNKELGNYFYWYVKIESQDMANDLKIQFVFKKILKVFLKQLKKLAIYKEKRKKIDFRLISQNNSIESNINELDSSEDHIEGSSHNVNQAIPHNAPSSSFPHNALETGFSDNDLEYSDLIEQINFVKKLSQVSNMIRNLKKTTPEKQEFLKSFLTKNEAKYKFFDPRNQQPLTLPLNPKVQILHIIPESCTVFKSSLSPLKLTFKILSDQSNIDEDEDAIDQKNWTYSFMYKVGDDLRQDQLVIQIIKLVEKLLKDENLNLKLNPYKILATNLNEGMIEFVPNSTLDKILTQYSGILNFFKTENPFASDADTNINPVKNIENVVLSDLESNIAEAMNNVEDTAPVAALNQISNPALTLKDIHPKIMDNFVKSCAGYCVITYLLGIGDRHLDNLLICNNGKFFHVDFGYILGKDPKPFPPLMKLPIEIIEGFGGLNSTYFVEFKNYCYICFLTLRKNSNLILNLLELMTSGNIPDLKIDSKNAIMKVRDKFMLHLSDEEAIVYFQNLINDSVNAFLPVVIDKLHSLAQYWRA